MWKQEEEAEQKQKQKIKVIHTFPPRTSSPIIRHAAVDIFLLLRSNMAAEVDAPDDVMFDSSPPARGVEDVAADEWAKLGRGCERCRIN
jgi:hypothetical protein